jgi:hypothetical protein
MEWYKGRSQPRVGWQIAAEICRPSDGVAPLVGDARAPFRDQMQTFQQMAAATVRLGVVWRGAGRQVTDQGA